MKKNLNVLMTIVLGVSLTACSSSGNSSVSSVTDEEETTVSSEVTSTSTEETNAPAVINSDMAYAVYLTNENDYMRNYEILC